MSSEIYYDRAFIRVGDRFIPVVNHGSSNCFDFDAHGREVGKHRFSLTDTNEFDDDRPLEPTIALALPDGSYLRAVVYEDDHFPAINIYWDHDGGKASELLCFAEYNSERDEGAQVCIGTYVSDEDETQYYAPYMAERNNEP